MSAVASPGEVHDGESQSKAVCCFFNLVFNQIHQTLNKRHPVFSPSGY